VSATNITTQSISQKDGSKRDVKVGAIQVTIGGSSDSTAIGNIPSWFKGFANGLAGHQVSDTRVLASLVLFVAALIWTVVLIYSGLVGGILATGRNPLSGGWVFLNIIAILVYVSLIMSITVGLIFVILRS
jgi:hypothetical protein